MKRILMIALLLILTANAVAPRAGAADCKSIAQVTGDIWKKWGAVIVAVGCGVVAATGHVDPKACLKSPKYADAVSQMVTFFNDQVNNNWATIGPRRIELGVNQEGDLFGPG